MRGLQNSIGNKSIQHMDSLTYYYKINKANKLCCLTLDEMKIQMAVKFDPSSGSIRGKLTLSGHSGETNRGLVFMLGSR